MNEPITVQGTVLNDGSLQLDGPITLPPGPVEVVVRPVSPKRGETGLEVLLRIRAEQEASGYVPRSAEEVHAQLQQMYDEWDERDREIEAIHEMRDRAKPQSPPGTPE